jgi:hypothetical protein
MSLDRCADFAYGPRTPAIFCSLMLKTLLS